MGFADIRARHFRRIVLNPNRAESVEYIPDSGAPRVKLVAVVKPAMDVPADNQGELVEREVIEVLISSDPSAQETFWIDGAQQLVQLGGIREPVHGDRLVRECDRDADSFAYVTTVQSNEYSHRLQFGRRKPMQIGTNESKR